MRAPTSVFLALSASAALLLGCDRNRPLEPVDPADVGLAASGSQLAAPTIASVMDSGESQIDIKWQDNSSNETGFEVHRSTTGESGAFALLVTTGANAVAHSDKGLELGVYYCYRLRAVRAAGGKTTYSAFSSTLCSATAPTVLAPSNANAVATPETRIDLSWQDNSSGETGFQIYRSSTGETGTFYLLATTGANGVVYSDASVEPGTRYCYRVRAAQDYTVVTGANTSGTTTYYSAFSNIACATPPLPSGPPTAAYEVSAKPIYSSGVVVTVRWTDNSTTAPAYRLYRSTDGGAAWGIVSLYWSDGMYWDYPLPYEQPVCYRVIAYNAVGDGPPSNTACTVPPAAPTDLIATAVDSQTLELRWRDNSAFEDGYQVWVYYYRGSMACNTGGTGAIDAGTWEMQYVIAELPANSTTYRAAPISTDACGTSAWYYVVAMKDGGGSDPSDNVSAAIP
jgi:hypothetical protein